MIDQSARKGSLSSNGWLLDCGNTAIKLCYSEEGRLGKRLAMGRKSYETDRFLAVQQLRQATAQKPPADFVVAALGREEDRPLLGELLTFLMPGKTALIVSGVLLRSMRIHYRAGQPGADRVANAFAVRQRFPGQTAVAIDFGTATNLVVVGAEGDFLGGAILPGPTVQLDSLHRHTAGRLPELNLRQSDITAIRALGQSTQAALEAGVLLGTAGAVESLLAELREELAQPSIPVVATGGHYHLVARWLHTPVEFAESLTFEGLLAYLDAEGS